MSHLHRVMKSIHMSMFFFLHSSLSLVLIINPWRTSQSPPTSSFDHKIFYQHHLVPCALPLNHSFVTSSLLFGARLFGSFAWCIDISLSLLSISLLPICVGPTYWYPHHIIIGQWTLTIGIHFPTTSNQDPIKKDSKKSCSTID